MNMIRRTLLLLSILAIILCQNVPSIAAETKEEEQPLVEASEQAKPKREMDPFRNKQANKLFYGIVDIVTSPKEFFHYTHIQLSENKNFLFGLTKGLIVSPFYVIKKAGLGLVNALTFPVE